MIFGQSHRHWSRSFNEESSLLSGAVVGGGVGPSAIYYNPACIADAQNTSLSIHASLFSFDFYNLKNALGEEVPLNASRGIIQPRFISYLIRPKKNKDFSIEFAYLNNELFHVEFNRSVEKVLDILNYPDGDERYFASFQYLNIFRDDWIGVGTSWKLNDHLFLGGSMFVQVKHNEYTYSLDIDAHPLSDTVMAGDMPVPFYTANYLENEAFKFNDYRLVWKLAVLYKKEKFSLGMTFRTPSIHVYSDGKRVSHKQTRSNIYDKEENDFLPNYLIVDYQEKKNVNVDYKDPFSIAAGLTWYIDERKTLFTTVEYFHGLDLYPMISADENASLLDKGNSGFSNLDNWLTFYGIAKPVLNAGAGYRWKVKEKLLVMAGFRTDFNYWDNKRDIAEDNYYVSKKLGLDVYHITGGVQTRILGQDLLAGVQYSIGRKTDVENVANLADPAEYNPATGLVLQGNKQNNMNVFYNAISVYFGATFNFGQKKK